VPAHDARDGEFAQKFGLPIRTVVRPPMEWLHSSNVYPVLEDMQRGLDQSFQVGDEERPPEETPPTLRLQITRIMSQASQVGEVRTGDLERIVVAAHERSPISFKEPLVGDGTAVQSGEFNGLSTPEFKRQIVEWLEARELGCRKVNYKLRDWLFSR